jgi:hypothetical protein
MEFWLLKQFDCTIIVSNLHFLIVFERGQLENLVCKIG